MLFESPYQAKARAGAWTIDAADADRDRKRFTVNVYLECGS